MVGAEFADTIFHRRPWLDTISLSTTRSYSDDAFALCVDGIAPKWLHVDTILDTLAT